MCFFRFQRNPIVTPARLQENAKENYLEMRDRKGPRYEYEHSDGEVLCVVVSIVKEKKL